MALVRENFFKGVGVRRGCLLGIVLECIIDSFGQAVADETAEKPLVTVSHLGIEQAIKDRIQSRV